MLADIALCKITWDGTDSANGRARNVQENIPWVNVSAF
jgi:hypothetical protein